MEDITIVTEEEVRTEVIIGYRVLHGDEFIFTEEELLTEDISKIKELTNY